MLKIIAVTDGRPGHEKQTRGIIATLEDKKAVRVTWIRLSRSMGGRFRELVCFLFPFGQANFSGNDADLVLCAGSRTHFRALALKRRFRVPACVCMDPGVVLRRFFDGCFIPEHDDVAAAANILTTCGPPNPCVNKKRHDSQYGLILLGGIDRRSHTWDSRDVIEKIRFITEKEPQMSWVISSSPRTPIETVSLIRELLTSKGGNLQFFDYKDTSPGWIEEQYQKCQKVWVTADSMSMVYEALSSGCLVGLLPLRWRKGGIKFRKNEETLVAGGLVTSFNSWRKNQEMVLPDPDFNEAQKCANFILNNIVKNDG